MKALVVDSTTSKMCDWFEFENIFGFDRLCAGISKAIGHETPGDFQAAMAEVLDTYTTDDLLNGS